MTWLLTSAPLLLDFVEGGVDDGHLLVGEVDEFLGHTFGHAIEAHQGYGSWLHGEAVGAGMAMALDLSCRLGWITDAERDRGVALISAAGLPTVPPKGMVAADFERLMSVDKKVLDGQLRLVLLRGMGEAVVTAEFTADALRQCLVGFEQ